MQKKIIKKKIVLKNFQSRLCFYINLDFLQFYFLSAKILHFKDIIIKYKIFYIKKQEILSLKFFKSLLRTLINLDFLQFLFNICQNIYFTKSFITKIYLLN